MWVGAWVGVSTNNAAIIIIVITLSDKFVKCLLCAYVHIF